MVGIAEISAAMASLQAGKDLLAAMIGARDGANLQELRISLQSMILEAQQGLFAAQQLNSVSDSKIAQLEQEIIRLKNWDREKSRYELVAVAPTAFAYMQKEGMRTNEPAHWLCANCFSEGKKSILQSQQRERAPHSLWACPTCKASIVVFYSTKPAYAAVPAAQ